MFESSKQKNPTLPKLPAWLVISAVLGAAALALLMFGRDYSRERGFVQELFLQKGEAVARFLFVGARGDFDEALGQASFDRVMANLDPQEGVLFMALADSEGRVLVQSGEKDFPEKFFRPPDPPPSCPGRVPAKWVETELNGRGVFMVYRPIWRPKRAPMMMRPGGHHGRDQDQPPPAPGPPDCPQAGRFEPGPPQYLWIAFDPGPFDQASNSRVRNSAVFTGLLGLAGLAGILALFWGHNSRLTRRRYQDTRAMLAQLIKSLPIAFWLMDQDGRITLVNRAAADLSGLSEKELLGRGLADLVQGAFPQGDAVTGLEAEIKFAGGQELRVVLNGGPVIGDDGRYLGRVLLMEDLGELGRLKARLAERERLAVLGGLAAGLAHEIRNPLGAVKGLCRHLMAKSPEEREILEVMETALDRLNATVTAFLDYARPPEPRLARLDLAELLRKTETLISHDAQSRAVAMRSEPPEGPVWINGDESLLIQAFLNLYLNAIQALAGRPGGALTVTLAKGERAAEINFQDNGPGFSPEQLEKPFLPYFTTKPEGSGLGLALVEKTVAAHGGRARLSAAPGGGARIVITLNLAKEPNHAG